MAAARAKGVEDVGITSGVRVGCGGICLVGMRAMMSSPVSVVCRALSTGAPRVCLQPSGARTSSAWAVLATCSTGVVWPGCQRGHVGPVSGPRSGGARVPVAQWGPSGR